VGRPLSVEEVGSRVRARFGDDVEVVESFGQVSAIISVERYHDLIRFLRDEPEFACDFCDFTGGVDLGPERGFEVVTQLTSTAHHHEVRVKVALPHEDPVCPTISDLYPTCDWHERETMEMFGIRFAGHPRPVKLLLAEPFDGFPLRKDFPLMSREVKPWPGAAEGEEEEDEE
jgi:NADH-quinone oxidoreductase subunit C